KNYYGSANPYLLGVILDGLIENSLEWYMDEKLFEPLGISQYIVQSDEQGRAYFGGGVYLRPRDMLSFGQLYLNEGSWNGQQIFSADWAKQSLEKYGPLLNANDRNQYGFLFWHKDYNFGDRKVASIEARGAGGQYIMIIPELELSIVISSGNYRNGRFALPEEILQNYILPALEAAD
ncbi:MAG: serine hydrolase, partial [Bacteroidota bacterium]